MINPVYIKQIRDYRKSWNMNQHQISSDYFSPKIKHKYLYELWWLLMPVLRLLEPSQYMRLGSKKISSGQWPGLNIYSRMNSSKDTFKMLYVSRHWYIVVHCVVRYRANWFSRKILYFTLIPGFKPFHECQ